VKSVIMQAGAVALWVSYAGFGASGQATSEGLTVKAVAEVETGRRRKWTGNRRGWRRPLVWRPATRSFTPWRFATPCGDGENSHRGVAYPVPAHMRYGGRFGDRSRHGGEFLGRRRSSLRSAENLDAPAGQLRRPTRRITPTSDGSFKNSLKGEFGCIRAISRQ
jgi:hypothetical protein